MSDTQTQHFPTPGHIHRCGDPCEFEKLQSQLSQVQGERDELVQKNCELDNANIEVWRQRDALKAENEKLKIATKGWSLDFKEVVAERDSLQKEVQKITKDRDSWADMYEDLLKRTKDLAKEVERLSGKTGICTQREQYAKEVQRLRGALEKIAFRYRYEDLKEVSIHGLLGRAEGIAMQALWSNEKA